MRQCWHNFLGISHISFITGTLLVHWWHELFQPHVNTTVKRNNSTPLPVFESSKFVRFWTEIFHDFCSNTSVKNQQWYIKLQALKLGGCQSFNPLWTVGLRNLTFYRLSQFSLRMWKIWDASGTLPFSAPEAALLLVNTENRDFWEEVRDSWTSRHSAHAWSQSDNSDWLRIRN